MKYIHWALLLIPHVVVKIASWLLAYVAVRWFSSDDKLTLKAPFGWLMTRDNDLSGDSYWKDGLNGADPLADKYRVAWIRKNGGHKLNYDWFGVDVDLAWLAAYRDPTTQWITGGPLWVSSNAFCLRYPFLGLEFYAGWNLLGPQDGRAKYWIQLRKEDPLNPSVPVGD